MPTNSGVMLFILFIIQIFILYLFSKDLIAKLQYLFYRLSSGSQVHTDKFLSFIFFPGTLIHELAHALTATLLLVKVHSFSLIPTQEHNSIKLGSVEISKSDPFRRALIGVAPVIWGVALLLLITWLIETKIPLELSFWWVYLILAYSIFVVSNTMFSSKKDLEGLLLFNILIITIVSGLIILGVYQPFIWLAQLLNSNYLFLVKLNIYLLVPISVDIIIYAIFRLFKIN